MSGVMDILNQKKWRDLFIYQFVLPVSIIIVFASGLGIYLNSPYKILLQFAFDGEFSLISVLLIVGTVIELGGTNNNRINRTTSLYHFWPVFVFCGIIFFVFNKMAVFECSNCITDSVLTQREIFFVGYNLIFLVASPLYCFTSIKSLSRR